MVEKIKAYELGLNSAIRFRQKQLLFSNIAKIKEQSYNIFISDSLFSNISLILIPIVDNNGKIGFVDKVGNIVISPLFDQIKGSFCSFQDLVAVKRNKRWTIIDAKGKELLPCEYTTIWLSKDSSIVSLQYYSGWQVMDVSNGDIIVDKGEFDYIEGFRFGFARVKKNGLWGVINKDGKVVIPTEYRDLLDFYDNWDRPETKVRKHEDDEWKFINLLTL